MRGVEEEGAGWSGRRVGPLYMGWHGLEVGDWLEKVRGGGRRWCGRSGRKVVVYELWVCGRLRQ
jgi:hypothetical protein